MDILDKKLTQEKSFSLLHNKQSESNNTQEKSSLALLNESISKIKEKKVLEIGLRNVHASHHELIANSCSIVSVCTCEATYLQAKNDFVDSHFNPVKVSSFDFSAKQDFDFAFSLNYLFCFPLEIQEKILQNLYSSLKPGGISLFNLLPAKQLDEVGQENISFQGVPFQIYFAHPSIYKDLIEEKIGFLVKKHTMDKNSYGEEMLWFQVQKP